MKWVGVVAIVLAASVAVGAGGADEGVHVGGGVVGQVLASIGVVKVNLRTARAAPAGRSCGPASSSPW